MSDTLQDDGCICSGNWRKLVKETEHLIGKRFRCGDTEYTFFGLVYGEDDYYYGMVDISGVVALLSCVGSIEGHGFKQVATLPSEFYGTWYIRFE